jgi:hypothetical protein
LAALTALALALMLLLLPAGTATINRPHKF